jgi:succinate dehydrogenase / fumarate reductase cytochrome b subunit
MFPSPVTSLSGRYEFLVRRIHSLLGLAPIGGYMFIHLTVNASLLDGAGTFQGHVDQINSLGPTTLLLVEWAFIFLPILFHGLVGLMIVLRGDRNIVNYSFAGNFRYTLQRYTGVIAMVFILYHVFQMHGWFRWEWWHAWIKPYGGAVFDPHNAAATASAAIQSALLVGVVYLIGVAACVYHLANGLWTMGITWGVWTTPRAQRWATCVCATFGIFLAIVGFGSLFSMETYKPPLPGTAPVTANRNAQGGSPQDELAPLPLPAKETHS